MANYYREHLARYYAAAMDAGMPYGIADAVRRDTQRMHTISEHECNGILYRCEESGKPRCIALTARGNVSPILIAPLIASTTQCALFSARMKPAILATTATTVAPI